MDKYLRPSLTELVGTFAVVFVGAGVVCATQLAEGSAPPATIALNVAIAQGFILAAALAATLSISGGFLNPAITLTLWVFRRLDGQAAIWFIGAQMLGSVLAGLALRLIFADTALFPQSSGLGMTPHLNRDSFQPGGGPLTFGVLMAGIGVELVLTFILAFAIFATVMDPRAPRLGGLGVGLAMTAVVLTGFALTGAAVNPARWFGPALWELTSPVGRDALRDHTVYWIGPVFGALLAGAFYEYLVLGGETAPVETPDPRTAAPVTSTLYRAKK